MTFDNFIDGNVVTQIIEAGKMIRAQIKSFARLGKDGKFHTKPEYPQEVWTEAIVNACVHRSYNLGNMNIFVKIFDNRFVVESPGGFMAPTTGETVYESHNPRNPFLMGALYYLDFVKCAYEGTRRMREGMREANLPEPEFAQKQVGTSSVHVVLRNNIEHRRAFLDPSIAENIGAAMYERLTDNEKMLCNYIFEKGFANVSDANRLISKDWHAAKAILDGLVERGVLERKSRSGKERDPHKRYSLVVRNGRR